MEMGVFREGAGSIKQLNLRGVGAHAVMAAFRDMEELSQGLLSLLSANHAEAQQRRLLGRHGQIMERLLETQNGAEEQLRGESGSQGGGAVAAPAVVMGGDGRSCLANSSLPGAPISCSVSRGTSRWELLTLSLRFPTCEMSFGTAAISRA